MRARKARPFTVAITAGLAAGALGLAAPAAVWADNSQGDQQGEGGPLTVTTLISGKDLTHTFTDSVTGQTRSETLSKPDDITRLGDHIFVGFQNGVGAEGGASGNNNPDSTVVELTTGGKAVAQWDITGKDDGLTADPALHALIATVNEDGLSSLYTIMPATNKIQNYSYNNGGLTHFGGTDAISILDGQILISASAPGNTGGPPLPQPYPAVYSVTLDPSTLVATVTPFFGDTDPATVANVGTPQSGQTVTLGLTDPDSSEVVPWNAPRFGDDYMLTSQGDQQQIFVHSHGGSVSSLSVLNLSQAVDDTAWPESGGTLFATDSTNNAVDAVTGGFPDRPVVAVTPCGSNNAPGTCPAPGFPANNLGTVNPWTGQVDPLATTGVAIVPQGGLLFVPTDQGGEGSQGGQGSQKEQQGAQG